MGVVCPPSPPSAVPNMVSAGSVGRAAEKAAPEAKGRWRNQREAWRADASGRAVPADGRQRVGTVPTGRPFGGFNGGRGGSKG